MENRLVPTGERSIHTTMVEINLNKYNLDNVIAIGKITRRTPIMKTVSLLRLQ